MFWWIGEGPRRVGRVEVHADHLSLSATTPGAEVDRVPFAELTSVLLERSVLHLARDVGEPVCIGSLDTPGALRELSDRLSDAVRLARV